MARAGVHLASSHLERTRAGDRGELVSTDPLPHVRLGHAHPPGGLVNGVTIREHGRISLGVALRTRKSWT